MTTEFKLVKDKSGKPTGNIITPLFRGAYVNLFVPKGIKGDANAKLKYSIAMLFPKETSFDLLKTAITEAAKIKWGTKAEDVLRKQQNSDKRIFKDQGDNDAAGFIEGCVFIQASNATKPGLVGRKAGLDGSLIELTDEESVWSGDYFIASIRPFAWDHPVGGKGVSLSLQNVQLIKKGDRLGGGRSRPSDEFEAMDEADMEDDGNEEKSSTKAGFNPFD